MKKKITEVLIKRDPVIDTGIRIVGDRIVSVWNNRHMRAVSIGIGEGIVVTLETDSALRIADLIKRAVEDVR